MTSSSPSAPSPSLASRLVRTLAVGGGILLLAALLLAAYATLRLGWNAWHAYTTSQRIVASLADHSQPLDRAALRADLVHLAADASDLQRGLTYAQPLVGTLAAASGYGPLLELARPALTLTHDAAIAVESGVAGAPAQEGNPLALVGAIGPQLAPLAPQLDALALQLAQLPTAAIPLRLRDNVDALRGGLPLVAAGAVLGPQLPALLGLKEPRTYLILVQNNHELRATGGFISAVGRITLDQGQIVALDFVDSYAIYRDTSEYPWAPAPMAKYLGIQLLVARDANWSPDLPTSARVFNALYAQDTGLAVDGLIVVDLNAVKLLTAALEPLTVPGADQPITAANLEEQLLRFWAQPTALADAPDQAQDEQWWLHRKDFVAVVARAILERLQQGNLDVVSLAAALEQSLAARAVQLWLADPPAQAALHDLGWDGALRPEPGADFLAVVDTNMGYNKADAAIQRAVDYTVAWPEGADGSAEVALTLTYTHTAPPGTDPECKPEPRYGETYADMIGRCYFSYLRVYTPDGSELIRATGVPTDSVHTMPGERGTTQFTGYVVVEPGATRQIQLRYRLPPTLTPADYRLIVQRQAGTEPLALHLTVGDRDQRVLIEQDRWRYP